MREEEVSVHRHLEQPILVSDATTAPLELKCGAAAASSSCPAANAPVPPPKADASNAPGPSLIIPPLSDVINL
ncbi:hypothetical protein INR49_029288 [Caranx melampygus]|nr:hypothetical protein INR49_029288 [Caranx melampygus]